MLREFINQLEKLPQKVMTNTLETDTIKPVIAVIVAQSQQVLAHRDLDEVAKRVEMGILANGGNYMRMYVPAIDSTAMTGTNWAKYDLPSRDLVADSVESMVSNDFFDGIVFIASEPNCTAGMLLGAIRVNIPSMFVCGGTMSPIVENGMQYGFTHLFRQVGKVKTGETDFELLSKIENNTPLATGTDCSRFGANSFNCALETLGLAVQGNGTAPAMSTQRMEIARKTGMAIVKAAQDRLTPRRMVTPVALLNAVISDLACGGSSTTMLNIIAIGKELSYKNVTLKSIGDLAKSTPVLLHDKKNGIALMNQFNEAGGMYAMLKQLCSEHLVNADCVTYNGTLQSVLQNVSIADSDVIRTSANCHNETATLRVLYGNVAEEGSFVHYKGESAFVGNARVYHSEESAIDALMHREIRPKDVIVIQNEGPKSCPGMREINASLALIEGMGLQGKVAVITDGRIADFYEGIAVGHITPETNEHSLFAVLQDGDEIEISVAKGKINCDLKTKEIQQRLKDYDNHNANYANHYLKKWARTVGTASDGCFTKLTKK